MLVCVQRALSSACARACVRACAGVWGYSSGLASPKALRSEHGRMWAAFTGQSVQGFQPTIVDSNLCARFGSGHNASFVPEMMCAARERMNSQHAAINRLVHNGKKDTHCLARLSPSVSRHQTKTSEHKAQICVTILREAGWEPLLSAKPARWPFDRQR